MESTFSSDPNLSAFSLLPAEIQVLIADYLTYQEILNFCQVEKSITNLCRDDDFWSSLLHHRYQDRLVGYKEVKDPRILFRQFETLDQVIITNRERQVFSFFTNNQSEIYGAVLAYGLLDQVMKNIEIYGPRNEVLSLYLINRDIITPIFKAHSTLRANLLTLRKTKKEFFKLEARKEDNLEYRYLINLNDDIIRASFTVIRYFGFQPSLISYRLDDLGQVVETTRNTI